MFSPKQVSHLNSQTYSLISCIGNYPENVSRKRARSSHTSKQVIYWQILVRAVLVSLIHDRENSLPRTAEGNKNTK